MAKAQDPPSPVDAYEAPPPPMPAGAPMPPQYAATSQYSATPEYSLTPPQYAPVYAPAQRSTNVLAIIALVASCVGFQIPGIIMGYIALSQIKKTGEAGHGLALAAVIVGWVLLVIVIVGVVVYLAFIFWIIGVAGTAANDYGDYSNLG